MIRNSTNSSPKHKRSEHLKQMQLNTQLNFNMILSGAGSISHSNFAKNNKEGILKARHKSQPYKIESQESYLYD